MRTLVWFRGKELRVRDHEPLQHAVRGGEAICVFVLDPFFFDAKQAVELPHRMQFMLESLSSLEANVAHLGSRLFVVAGSSLQVIPALARQLRIDKVVGHRWTEPFGRTRDARIQEALSVPFELSQGETFAPPASLRTGSGTAFSIFTPFAKAHRANVLIGPTLAAPRSLPAVPPDVAKALAQQCTDIPTLASLGIAHNPNLIAGGERAGQVRLKHFLETVAGVYAEDRDRMDGAGTSRLSADLKFGTVSVRNVWNTALAAMTEKQATAWKSFSNELLWREFAHAVLWENRALLKTPHRKGFADFPWVNDAEHWAAWCQGNTGYPVVDAAARQLLAEGYVHNRARMITASFLTKHLLIDYRKGEAHYMKYLVDGDWAQNNAGWQWATGCGFDAQPYFRVFNPMLQGSRFDPDGAYVKRWVPELAGVDTKHIHTPWEAPSDVGKRIGLGKKGGYPLPIVDHAKARQRFLDVAKRHLQSQP